ncbi:MAG: hypothetical protein ACR2FO_01650 [Actinomycetota bacterium]
MVELATHAPGEPHLFGWYLGIGIAFATIVVVVVVVASILTLARRIGIQAQEAIVGLDAGRANTLALWDVDKANESAKRIAESLRAARSALGG